MSKNYCIKKKNNHFQEKQNIGPIKLKLLLNINNDINYTPNFSYNSRPRTCTHSNYIRQKTNNNRNLSFVTKTPKNCIFSSKTFRDNKSCKKNKNNSMYNFLLKNTQFKKEVKSIRTKKNDIINLLVSRSSKDVLINLLSLKDKSKKKNSNNYRTNNYTDPKYKNTEMQTQSNKTEKDYYAIPLHKNLTSINTKDDTNLLTNSDKFSFKSTDLFNKLESIKIKTSDLLEKYNFLAENLRFQLKLERYKNQFNNNNQSKRKNKSYNNSKEII